MSAGYLMESDAKFKITQTRRALAIEQAKVNEVRLLLYEDDDDDDDDDETVPNKLSIRHKLNRLLLEFTALLSLIDFLAYEPHGQVEGQNTRMATLQLGSVIRIPLFKYRKINVSEWGQRARRKLWPYLLPSLWLASSLHQIYIIYQQSLYDYNKFRLARVRWLNRTQGPEFKSSSLEREDFLLARMEKQVSHLKRIGAPNIHLSFIAEASPISNLINTFVFYIWPIFYFKWLSPFDFYFLRNLYDFKREQRHIKHFVQLEVRKFIHSIREYSRSLYHYGVTTKDNKFVSPGGGRLIDCATVERSLLCKQLEEMLAAGHLRPLNQRPKWVDSWRNYYNCFVIFCYGYAIFIDRLAYFLSDNYDYEYDDETSHIATNLYYVEAKYWIFLNHTTVTFHGAASWFTCHDQIELVNKLRKLLSLTVQLNELRLHRHQHLVDYKWKSNSTWLARVEVKSERKIDNCSTTSQMNRDILLFLMHYRLFVAQLDKVRQSLGFISIRLVIAILLVPLLGRIIVPYLEVEKMPQSRQLIFTVSYIIMIYNDIYLAPVCYLHKRCVELYCDLNSLLAHLMQVNLDDTTREKFDRFDNHDRHILISILRKELSHHDQAMKKFSIQYLGFNFTYNNLVSLHVYIGVLLLFTMGENLAQIKETTGTIFTDPLGLF